jgi:hypothetical protein
LLPGECESVLDHVEEGLHISEDASADVLDVPRLQKLRMAVLEYLAEPIEAVS